MKIVAGLLYVVCLGSFGVPTDAQTAPGTPMNLDAPAGGFPDSPENPCGDMLIVGVKMSLIGTLFDIAKLGGKVQYTTSDLLGYYRDDGNYQYYLSNYCHDVATRDGSYGMALEGKAHIEHVQGTAWQDDMNLAVQKLELCTTEAYGTPLSATCQTHEDEAVHFQVMWETNGN